jgi:predicted HTH transcriptional regulator
MVRDDEIEHIAVRLAIAHEEARGWVVESVESENRGFDLVWEQVVAYLKQNGDIGNAQIRSLLGTEDTLTASKQLKAWVEQGVLIVKNPEAGRNVRRYGLPDTELPDFFSSLYRKEPTG